jgi:O-antigen/teichoic acid export membrane protein
MLIEYGLPLILGGFVTGHILAAVICGVGISQERRFEMHLGWLLPSGFWAFSSTTMMSTVFSFLYANIDRLAIYSSQDLEGLGMYQAVLTVNALIEKIPSLLQPSIMPTFSNLLGARHFNAFNRAFSLLSRWCVVPVTLASLAMMAFSREILGIFGPEFVENDYLLTLFGLVGIIRSLNLATNVANTCMEKNVFRFVQQFLNILGQGVLTLTFMSEYGVIAIAGAKMISVSIASLAGVLYVFFELDLRTQLPLTYKSALLVGVVMAILRIWVVPTGLLLAVVLMLSCTALFLILSRFSWHEIGGIIRLGFQHDTSVLIEAVR